GILRALPSHGPINGDVGGRSEAQSRQNVADTYGIGNHSEGRNQNNTNGEKKNEKRREPQFGPCDNRETMAHTSCTRREECDDAAITDQSGHGSRGGDAESM